MGRARTSTTTEGTSGRGRPGRVPVASRSHPRRVLVEGTDRDACRRPGSYVAVLRPKRRALDLKRRALDLKRRGAAARAVGWTRWSGRRPSSRQAGVHAGMARGVAGWPALPRTHSVLVTSRLLPGRVLVTSWPRLGRHCPDPFRPGRVPVASRSRPGHVLVGIARARSVLCGCRLSMRQWRRVAALRPRARVRMWCGAQGGSLTSPRESEDVVWRAGWQPYVPARE